MRWDCERQGCFNVKKRPKIEMFADCLPRRIAFTDVDGVVELAGNLLFLEWKDHRGVGTGQRILFERLTLHCPAVVFIVQGDAELMTVEAMCIARRGRLEEWRECDVDWLHDTIKGWSDWAEQHPYRSTP